MSSNNFTFILQFNVLKFIGGVNGNNDGEKVLEPVVHSLISPKFLSSISWTGRGRGKERKISLNFYENLVNLITLIVNKADTKFSQLKTLNTLKYKIIKYAQTKFGDRDPSSTNSDATATSASSQVYR